MKELWILIAGSRDYANYSQFENVMDYVLKRYINDGNTVSIISGGASGADSMAERYAAAKGYNITVMPAEWSKYKNRAGYIRNAQMHMELSKHENRICICFWDGKSHGTQHNFDLSRDKNTPLLIFHYPTGKFIKLDK